MFSNKVCTLIIEVKLLNIAANVADVVPRTVSALGRIKAVRALRIADWTRIASQTHLSTVYGVKAKVERASAKMCKTT